MPIPTPRDGETQEEFIERCMPVASAEADSQEQAQAICFNAWRENRSLSGEVFHRKLVLDPVTDEDSRTVSAALSSEAPVDRWFGREILEHSDTAIDLSRASEGLPLLFNHEGNQPIGLVKNIRVESDKKLRGDLHFSPNSQKSREVWADVKDGFIRDISIGYRIDEWLERKDSDEVVATRWTPFEASVTPIPADTSVGINRSMEVKKMADDDKTPPTDKQGDDINVLQFEQVRKAGLDEGRRLGMEAEQTRMTEITEAFKPFIDKAGVADLKDECIRSMLDPIVAKEKLLDYLSRNNQPLAGDAPDNQKGNFDMAGDDQLDKFLRGAEDAICLRAGLIKDRDKQREIRRHMFAGMTMVEMAREFLRASGERSIGGDRRTVVGQAFTRSSLIGHSSSDFANLLANVANKALLMGWDETNETWDRWCRIGSLPDFKQASRPALNAFGDLDIVEENGEYKYGELGDINENLKLATYGKLFSIGRQALINDDLDSLSRIPRTMGRAAQRKIGDIAYAILTGNPTMDQDSTALFDAGHNNIGTGGVISTTTLDEARRLAALQTDPSTNATLGIRLKYLIVPVGLETSADVQMAAQDNPDTTGDRSPNPFRGVFEVVSDHRLDADSATEWYMAADEQINDTVEIAFLDGNTEPFMETKDGWTVDGVEYKVRIDAVAKALDFRGMFYNAGA